jgi:type II secretory pathway component GspD/PulD (secretin)
MANPTVIILDGRQATIHAGDKIYYPQIVGRDPLGGQIVQATQIDVGISLIVNPRIGPDGNITLTLVPTVSAITQSVFEGYPTITERSTVTTVRVKSGETLAIGGLIRDDETITVNKVPLLGDIPIIGDLLFKSTVKHPVRSEVVIIITPEVVES